MMMWRLLVIGLMFFLGRSMVAGQKKDKQAQTNKCDSSQLDAVIKGMEEINNTMMARTDGSAIKSIVEEMNNTLMASLISEGSEIKNMVDEINTKLPSQPKAITKPDAIFISTEGFEAVRYELFVDGKSVAQAPSPRTDHVALDKSPSTIAVSLYKADRGDDEAEDCGMYLGALSAITTIDSIKKGIVADYWKCACKNEPITNNNWTQPEFSDQDQMFVSGPYKGSDGAVHCSGCTGSEGKWIYWRNTIAPRQAGPDQEKVLYIAATGTYALFLDGKFIDTNVVTVLDEKDSGASSPGMYEFTESPRCVAVIFLHGPMILSALAIITDGQWKCKPMDFYEGADTEWALEDYDDSQWPNARVLEESRDQVLYGDDLSKINIEAKWLLAEDPGGYFRVCRRTFG